jgi:hypothetical protein
MDARQAALIAALRRQPQPRLPLAIPGREQMAMDTLNTMFPKTKTYSPSGVGPGPDVTGDKASSNIPAGLDYLKDAQLPQDAMAQFNIWLANLSQQQRQQLSAMAQQNGVTLEQLAVEFQKMGSLK